MYNTFPLKLFNRVNSLEKSVPQLFMHFHRSTNYLICLLVLHFINSALICACPVGPEDRTGVICGWISSERMDDGFKFLAEQNPGT